MSHVTIIGAGLAGCEAAYQAAKRGVSVTLYEMKPEKMTPAHHSKNFAELVCSNSLRSAELTNAAGLLKEEMRRLGSLIIEAADASRVAAGGALAVDRDLFSGYITDKIRNHPNITVVEKEISHIHPEEVTVIATGPLTSDAMAETIKELTGGEGLYFYDAAAPIVDFESVNMDRAFFASRYGKGDADYINCPMNREEYEAFYDALIHAEEAQLKEFDANSQKAPTVFEGCMPVEIMAKRGEDTLRFGPLKPVGIAHPETGETYYAVVQLRRENNDGTMYNLVGFQTHLTFPEQRRVFRMIPGLENAEFIRYGVMHRNTYLNSPKLLTEEYSLRANPNTYFAGQMTGVEGYIESAASGFVAGIAASCRALEQVYTPFSDVTEIGALAKYVSTGPASGNFQPMNANFGIIAPYEGKIKGGKRMRFAAYSERALKEIDRLLEEKL